MATYKLLIDEFEETDYTLIAIHTILEDYRLAFFLNKELPIFLSRSSNNVTLYNKKKEVIFQKFDFENVFIGQKWTLIQNNIEIVSIEKNDKYNLFFEQEVETETKIFLLPEFKNVDYFLKVDHPETDFETIETLEIIKKIYNISKVYQVEIENIKSKNNLIF